MKAALAYMRRAVFIFYICIMDFTQKLTNLHREQQALISSGAATKESLLEIENKIAALMQDRQSDAQPYKNAIIKKIDEHREAQNLLEKKRDVKQQIQSRIIPPFLRK